MRIALIFFELKSGGGVLQFLRLGRQLQKNGHHVTLFFYQNQSSVDESTLLEGMKYYSVLKPGEPQQVSRFSLLKKLNALKTLILKHGPFDVLNPHEAPAQLTAVLVKRETQTPIVWMCNDLWHVPEEEQQSLDDLLDWTSTFSPILQGVKQTMKNQEKNILSWFKRQARFQFDRYLTRQIDQIVVLDHRIQKLIKAYYDKHAIVIRSGFDRDRFKKAPTKSEAKKHLQLATHNSQPTTHNPQPFIFLLFAVIYPHRRFQDAIEAARLLIQDKSVPPFKLIIAGDPTHAPEYFEFLQTMVKRYNLESIVEFKTGFISYHDQVHLYAACDAFIFPNDRQTWGITPIELMSMGKPVIVSRGAGVHEVLDDEKTALLYPARDTEALAEDMKLLLTDEKQRHRLAKAGQALATTTFSWEKYAEEMAGVFASV